MSKRGQRIFHSRVVVCHNIWADLPLSYSRGLSVFDSQAQKMKRLEKNSYASVGWGLVVCVCEEDQNLAVLMLNFRVSWLSKNEGV